MLTGNSPFPTPSASDPSRPDLLANRYRKSESPNPYVSVTPCHGTEVYCVEKLTYTDGRVGAVIDYAKVFVTSLNSDTIPDPPLGAQRNVYRRADATYGPDDYICWP